MSERRTPIEWELVEKICSCGGNLVYENPSGLQIYPSEIKEYIHVCQKCSLEYVFNETYPTYRIKVVEDGWSQK